MPNSQDIRSFFGSTMMASRPQNSKVRDSSQNSDKTPSPKKKKVARLNKNDCSPNSPVVKRIPRKRSTVVLSSGESDTEEPIPSKISKKMGISKSGKRTKLRQMSSDEDDNIIPTINDESPGPSVSAVVMKIHEKDDKIKGKVSNIKQPATKAKAVPEKINLINADDFFAGKKVKKSNPPKTKPLLNSNSPQITSKYFETPIAQSSISGSQSTISESSTVTISPGKSMEPKSKEINGEKVSTPLFTIEDTQKHKITPGKQVSPMKCDLDDSGIIPPTPEQKKGELYRSYLHREGPQNIGEKEIPEGVAGCLKGKTFVLTGILESIEREDCKDLIEKLGGKVTGSISKKTSYVVHGRDSGLSKLAKADSFGTSKLDEDELFDLIRNAKGQTSPLKEIPKKKTPPKQKINEIIVEKEKTETNVKKISKAMEIGEVPPTKIIKQNKISNFGEMKPESKPELRLEDRTWVDKYKPTSVEQILGQQGDRSPVNKLLNWLRNWEKWHIGANTKVKVGMKSDDGNGFKCALLSGPPGIGKTTSATLCCQKLGLNYVEYNASDTRNKKSLELQIATMISNKSIDDYYTKGVNNSNKSKGKVHSVLIMDEVDGIAGNEDRGGAQELMKLIKTTRIPIICICNDRQSQKVRSLANYCFDLRFNKPKLEHVRSRILTIAFQEKLKISKEVADQLIECANNDIRQTIQHLNLLKAGVDNLDGDQASKAVKTASKDVNISIFEAGKRALTYKKEGNNLNEKCDMFFTDYSLMPLFVQENYPTIKPNDKRSALQRLEDVAKAADFIAIGDVIDRKIRSTQNWGLLNHQALFSTALPSMVLKGHLGGMLQFPQWLGKNSSTTKNKRLVQQLHSHMSLRISADLTSTNLDYIPLLDLAITQPLIEKELDGVVDVVAIYENYELTKDDVDAIHALNAWTISKPVNINSKVKAAVTRQYNKDHHRLPYASLNVISKKRVTQHVENGEEEEISDDEIDVKVFEVKKKPPAAKKKPKEKKK